jgi:hypothetical protein
MLQRLRTRLQALWAALPQFGRELLASLRADLFFWVGLVLAGCAMSVPQVRNVLLQTVQAPALASSASFWNLPRQVLSPSAWMEAAGFLVYLAFLFAATASSVLFVVPPSFLAAPGRLPGPPGRREAVGGVVLLLVLPVFVLLPLRDYLRGAADALGPALGGWIYPDAFQSVATAALLALMMACLFRPVTWLLRRGVGWLVALAESLSQRRRRWLGGLLVLAGLVVYLSVPVSVAVSGLGSQRYPLLGSAGQLFGALGVLTGFWLATAAEPLLRGWKRWVPGAVLASIGLFFLVSAGAAGDPADPWLGLAFRALVALALLAGCWLLTPGEPPGPAPLGAVRAAQGRLLGWVLGTCLFGEAVWGLAAAPYADLLVSYRLYTIWAVLEVATLIVLGGALLDTWQREVVNYPVRLAGLLAGVLFLVLVARAEPLGPPPPQQAEDGGAPEDWPKHLLARVRTVEKGEPVVFVAAAGGGSRAAIFAGLVLEALAREPFPGRPGDTWADHIVLVSGVSGGSLGSATFVHRLDQFDKVLRNKQPDDPDESPGVALTRSRLRNSVKAELIARMGEAADELSGAIAKEHRVRPSRQTARYGPAAKEVQEFCRKLREAEAPGGPDWVLASAVMDDLCTDFMAPVLRGALTPGSSRGEGLRYFWAQRFRWVGSYDGGGYARDKEPLGYDLRLRPLVVFNASDVRRGSRLAVGFPPLPACLLRGPVAEGAKGAGKRAGPPAEEEAGAGSGPRYPPEALADVDPRRRVGLAQAVGLSANFPFGFNATTLPRRLSEDERCGDKTEEELKEEDDQVAKVLDGGIVDNTGIDTLFRLARAIDERRRAARAGDVYFDLWKELMDRRVILIEIDSGAKPEKPGWPTKVLSVLFDPLAALNNAGFTNAALAKQGYYSDFQATFREPVDLGDWLARLGTADEQARARGKELQRKGVVRFSSLTFDANHFGGANVLTAWSLGPEDKAVLLVRFLTELHVARSELDKVARLPRQTLAEEVAQFRKAADDLVEARLKERASLQLTKALGDVRNEQEVIERLRKDGARSNAQLLSRLKKVEASLAEAKGLASSLGVGTPEFDKRVQDLEEGARDLHLILGKGGTPPKEMFKTLQVEEKGAITKTLHTLAAQRQTSRQKALKLLEEVNPQAKLQDEFTARAQESRKLFDKPPPKK